MSKITYTGGQSHITTTGGSIINGTLPTVGWPNGTHVAAANTNIFGYSSKNPNKYLVFLLPEEEIDSVPNKVYVNGMLLTIGVLGSDVQVAFADKKLVFTPGMLNYNYTPNNKITVIIDYGNYIYNYNVLSSGYGDVECEEDSNIVKFKLLSRVAQR